MPAVISDDAGILEIQFISGDRMKSLFKFAGAALFLMCAPLLRADSVLFTLTGADHVVSFSLPLQPTPDQSGKDFEFIPYFIFNDVAVTVDGVTTDQAILFSDSGDQHIAFSDADSFSVSSQNQIVSSRNISEAFFEEAQDIFSGPVDRPTFIPGTSTGFASTLDGQGEAATTLAIERLVPTPEPSSFVLLGSGLLGFAGVVCRKFLLRS
jgi:hypothetical protein